MQLVRGSQCLLLLSLLFTDPPGHVNAEPVIHTREFSLTFFPPPILRPGSLVWEHWEESPGTFHPQPQGSVRVQGTALQLGLCPTCWQDPREAELTPPAAGTGISPPVGPHLLEMCLTVGQVLVLTQPPAQEVLKGPAEEVTAVDEHTDMLHVNRNCSWPSTCENAGMLQEGG